MLVFRKCKSLLSESFILDLTDSQLHFVARKGVRGYSYLNKDGAMWGKKSGSKGIKRHPGTGIFLQDRLHVAPKMTNTWLGSSVCKRVQFSSDITSLHLARGEKGKIPQRWKMIQMMNVQDKTATLKFINSEAVDDFWTRTSVTGCVETPASSCALTQFFSSLNDLVRVWPSWGLWKRRKSISERKFQWYI